MRRAYTFILNHTAPVLAILSLLMIAEMGLAMWNIVPIGYEWLLRWILILTILAWAGTAGKVGVMRGPRLLLFGSILSIVGMVSVIILGMIPMLIPDTLILLGVLALMLIPALTGLITPTGHSGGKVYWIFVTAPLVFLWLINLYYISVVFFGTEYWESIVNIYFLLILGLIGGALGLLIQLHSERMSSVRYVVVVLRSLGAGAFVVVFILAMLVLSAIGSTSPWVVIGAIFIVVPVSASSSLAFLVAWWIGVMPPLWRKIFVSVLGLWMMYVAMGWFWLIAMDNGLRAFTGEERAAAVVALDKAERSYYTFDPSRRRVVRDVDGQFDVVFYTWWGLKARRQ